MRAILLAVLFTILLPVTLHAQDIEPLPSRSLADIVTVGPQTTSPDGIEFLKGLEGFRPIPYRDSGGGYSVGYGFQTWKGRRVTPSYPRRVTKDQATDELRRQLALYESIVRTKVGRPIEQHAFDALVSVCYNLGVVNRAIVNKLRAARAVTIHDFLTTVHAANKFSPTLYERRVREFALFVGRPDAPEHELRRVSFRVAK